MTGTPAENPPPAAATEPGAGDPTRLPEWEALARHRAALEGVRMADLFARDPGRAERMTVAAAGIELDFSKNRLTGEGLAALCALARARGLEARRADFFAGRPINDSEGRAVLHPALRAPAGRPFPAPDAPGGTGDVMAEVEAVRARMRRFARACAAGELAGVTGKPINHIVNIGIGGSDLGPRLAVQALAPYRQPGLAVDFVSNLDGADLAGCLAGCDPERTLFLVASKSFATEETLTNALSARAWLAARLGVGVGELGAHFAALSSHVEAAGAFGIAPERVFGFWDWVGGRFSLWSAVGLPVMIAIGPENFDAMLAGAHDMDRHFLSAPLESNMPVLLGLIGLWYRNFWDAHSLAVLPYDQRLARLPAHLQQLDMESNGKGVTRDGRPVPMATGPVVFGEPGTNGQHAFYQLLHHGPDLIPADFIAALAPGHDLPGHHRRLLAHFLAQPEALMRGRGADEVRAALAAAGGEDEPPASLVAQRSFPGNRPSNILLLDRLDPAGFGALIALYEHKIFVQGTIWGINSFDQWGVELGKRLAVAIEAELAGEAEQGDREEAGGPHDSSTARLITKIKASAP